MRRPGCHVDLHGATYVSVHGLLPVWATLAYLHPQTPVLAYPARIEGLCCRGGTIDQRPQEGVP